MAGGSGSAAEDEDDAFRKRVERASAQAMSLVESRAGASFRFQLFEVKANMPPFMRTFQPVNAEAEEVCALMRKTFPLCRGGADAGFKEAFNAVVGMARERNFVVAEAGQAADTITIKAHTAIAVRRPLVFKKPV